jgi:hypothetical protein
MSGSLAVIVLYNYVPKISISIDIKEKLKSKNKKAKIKKGG